MDCHLAQEDQHPVIIAYLVKCGWIFREKNENEG